MFVDRQNKMHTKARLYKIPLLKNKTTWKVMNLIKLAHRHLKVAGTPILGQFLCSISLYLQNYAVVGILKINFDCSENNLH